ncbi:MAG: hypothetical protein KGI51_15370 [Rhodospirillales bacterium]|nr:hypothetical protein [Rhodospirillales bacterium]
MDTTRRGALRLGAAIAGLGALGLAGCVAYPAYPGYPPNMVWMPSLNAYVATDYPYPLFFYSGIYYYVSGGRWYTGPNFRGPWRPIGVPPPPLRPFRASAWPSYQARARVYYQGNPSWRHFRPGR